MGAILAATIAGMAVWWIKQRSPTPRPRLNRRPTDVQTPSNIRANEGDSDVQQPVSSPIQEDVRFEEPNRPLFGIVLILFAIALSFGMVAGSSWWIVQRVASGGQSAQPTDYTTPQDQLPAPTTGANRRPGR